MNDEFFGEMKEFKRVVLEDLREIKKDVKLLNNFKWRVASGAAVLCFLLTIAIQVIDVIWRN